MSFETIWLKNCVIWNYSGKLSSNEVLASNNEVYSDPRFDTLKFEIVNLIPVTEMDLKPKDIKIVAALDRVASLSNPGIKVAFIVENDELLELVNLYRLNLKDCSWQTEIFSAIQDAADWLMLDNESKKFLEINSSNSSYS
jgi:hypothetical protein